MHRNHSNARAWRTVITVLFGLTLASPLGLAAEGCGSSESGTSSAAGGGSFSSGSQSGGANSGSGASKSSGSTTGGFVGSGASGSGSSASGASGTGGSHGGCTSAANCASGEVCDPSTHKCKALGCTKNTDCGKGAICVSGKCKTNEDGGACTADANCPTGETCMNGFCGCGGQLEQAMNVPPNVLIVLDRSSSMNDSITGGTKWTVAQQAIDSLVAQYGSQIRFGLMLFPGTDQSCSQGMECGPGTVFIDPAAMTGSAITTFLTGASTCHFGTPTAEALTPLETYSGLKDTTRGDFILLITDGMATCNDPVPIVAALLAGTPTIKTFVVGFGSAVDPTQLAAMATAGGTATPNPPSYYQADSPTSLDAAFSAIAGDVLSCTYVLSSAPPDPTQLYVYFDGQLEPNDSSNGWTYSSGTHTITFNGPACLSLQQGLVQDLVISYGCPVQTSGSSGSGSSGSGAGGGPKCTQQGGTCTVASDCCGGLNCIGGICSQPAPK